MPVLVAILSSCEVILSSSSSCPTQAHEARRGSGCRGSSQASGAGGTEAEGMQPRRKQCLFHLLFHSTHGPRQTPLDGFTFHHASTFYREQNIHPHVALEFQ